MAGDWIPMRIDLAGDPSTIAIANELGKNLHETVGILHHFWSWADSQLTDGNAVSVTFSNIDDIVGVTGCARALEKAGWLEANGKGLRVPNFENWMSKSAKKRLKTHKRVKRHRNAGSVSKTLLQNSTVQNTSTLTGTCTSQPKSTKDAPGTEHRKTLGRALAEATGFKPKAKRDHARIAKLVNDLLEHDARPEDCAVRAKRYPKVFPDASLTPEALVKHWPSLEPPERNIFSVREQVSA